MEVSDAALWLSGYFRASRRSPLFATVFWALTRPDGTLLPHSRASLMDRTFMFFLSGVFE